jgi:hypothetical protein
MTSKEARLARKIIRALANDWSLVEDFESDTWEKTEEMLKTVPEIEIPVENETLMLVNSNRDTMKGRRPTHQFVMQLEKDGYIENIDTSYTLGGPPLWHKHTVTTAEETRDVTIRDMRVYFFRPTAKGLALLQEYKSNK